MEYLKPNNLYLGDCFDKLKLVEDNSIDLIILDPEYQDWDNFIDKGIIELSMSKLKEEGNLVCFTKQPNDFKLRFKINDYFRREIIWKYNYGVKFVSKKLPLSSYQKVFWCCKNTKNNYFNPRTGLEYGKNTKSRQRKTVTIQNIKYEGRYFSKSDEGTWMKDSYEFNINRIKKNGYLSKPEKLMQVFIKCLCPENGIILDPFMGSGTNAILSAKLNRQFIGIELNKNNLEYSKVRFLETIEKKELNYNILKTNLERLKINLQLGV